MMVPYVVEVLLVGTAVKGYFDEGTPHEESREEKALGWTLARPYFELSIAAPY